MYRTEQNQSGVLLKKGRKRSFGKVQVAMDTNRLVAGAGVGEIAARGRWYTDNRLSHEHQAAYVGKLRRLREELIQQESLILTDALERLRFHASLKEQVQNNMLRRSKVDGAAPDCPSLHKRLQEEKQRSIEGRRRAKTPPRLNALEGKQLVKPRKDSRGKQLGTSRNYGGHSTDFLFDCHRKRAYHVDISSLRHTLPAIPSAHAHSQHVTQYPERSRTLLRQLAHHQKNPNLPGVYKAMQRRPPAARSYSPNDSLDLSVGVQSYESDSQHANTPQSTGSFDQYVQNILLRNAYHTKKTKKDSRQSLSHQSAKHDSSASLDSSLTNSDFLKMVEQENMPQYVNYSADGGADLAVQESSHNAVSCVICENPDINIEGIALTSTNVPVISPRTVTNSQKSARTVKEKGNSASKGMTKKVAGNAKSIVIPGDPGGAVRNISVQKGKRVNDQKGAAIVARDSVHQRVLPVPTIELMPATPTPSGSPDPQNTNLQKELKQNELRDREVKNLLEDIRELNSLSEGIGSKEQVVRSG